MIVFQSLAKRDIKKITLYGLDQFGESAASDYRKGLNSLLAKLLVHPGIGALVDAEREVRSFRFREHRVYYRQDGTNLTILRVLSQRQDMPDQL